MNFHNSEGFTVGIEIEIQLVDLNDFGLVSTSNEIIDAIKGLKGSIKHELMMSNLEINTKVCSSITEAEEDLRKKFDVVMSEAKRHNTILCCAGTHPFSSWKDQRITDNERYRYLLETLQIVARRFNIFGLHVHVGIDGGDRCIYIMNRMLYYLPHLLALSANSPFWEGEDTGLKSYRTKIFETLPIAGLPFYFNDWSDYSQVVEMYLSMGTIRTIRELWWDIRPHLDFGTLEVRICDTPSTIREILAIAALIQAFVKKLSNEYDEGIPFIRPHASILRENKWRASRYGLDAQFITVEGKKTIGAGEAIEGILSSLDKEVEDLGSGQYMDGIRDILVCGEGAIKQLKSWDESGDLKSVVKDTSERLRNDISVNQAGRL